MERQDKLGPRKPAIEVARAIKSSRLTIEDFFSTEAIPKNGMKKVESLLKSGRLFRYIESRENSEVALLEKDFATFLGVKYALALNSCSSAIFLSLAALGIKSEDEVLVPAFTFSAVPSSIIHAGAKPVLVECNETYRLDIEDLKKKITPHTKAIVLSHMRGHTSDIDEIKKICTENNIKIVEDAAHSLGVRWNNKLVGTFGETGCFSFQSYKLLNGGEGGILVTNDEDIMARAVLLSGAYEKNWQKHFIKTDPVNQLNSTLPLYNLRMSNLSAVIIRSQIPLINKRVEKGRASYSYVTKILSSSKFVTVPDHDERETSAPDSLQFNLNGFSDEEAREFMMKVRERGVSLYIFGLHDDNARVFWNWNFLEKIPKLPKTKKMLMRACDVRLPLTFTKKQLKQTAEIILDVAKNIKSSNRL